MSDPFLDIDFRKDPRYVRGDLTPDDCRAFGNGPRLFGASKPSYEDFYATIPENEWNDYIAQIDAAGGGGEMMVTRIFNQKNEGSCVGNAGTQAHQMVQALQFGRDKVIQLAAISLYQQIGSSPNSGATVDDCMDAGTKTGILPLDTPENRAKWGDACLPHTGFYAKKPDNWRDVAKLFRFHECLVIRSVDGLITALLNQHPVVVGRQGHSIVYCRPMYRNGSLTVAYVNSWGSWGAALGEFDHGFGFDSMGAIRSSASWAFAVRSVVLPGVAA